MSLKGVVAIVADGNSGIGMESAVALATAGPTSLTDCKITPIATAPMASAPCAAAPSPSAKFASVERASGDNLLNSPFVRVAFSSSNSGFV
jgi:hypothetical protein